MKPILAFVISLILFTGSVAFAEEASEVNINTAGVEMLEQLDGIGPKKAQAIAEWRERHGEFVSVEQLAEVDGIGDATIEANRERVVLE